MYDVFNLHIITTVTFSVLNNSEENDILTVSLVSITVSLNTVKGTSRGDVSFSAIEIDEGIKKST